MRYCRRTLKRIVANSDRFPIWTPVILYCTLYSAEFPDCKQLFLAFWGKEKRHRRPFDISFFYSPPRPGFIKLFIHIVICRTSEPGTAVQRKGH